MIQFTDGVTIDTNGEPRIKRIKGELYVVGKGVLIPVDNIEEAQEMIRSLNG